MANKHKWEWAKGEPTGVKQCVKCGIIKYPGHVFWPTVFFKDGKQVAEGKTPPCLAEPHDAVEQFINVE